MKKDDDRLGVGIKLLSTSILLILLNIVIYLLVRLCTTLNEPALMDVLRGAALLAGLIAMAGIDLIVNANSRF